MELEGARGSERKREGARGSVGIVLLHSLRDLLVICRFTTVVRLCLQNNAYR